MLLTVISWIQQQIWPIIFMIAEYVYETSLIHWNFLLSLFMENSGIILGISLADERWRYIVMSSLNGQAHTQNDPWELNLHFCNCNQSFCVDKIQAKLLTTIYGGLVFNIDFSTANCKEFYLCFEL